MCCVFVWNIFVRIRLGFVDRRIRTSGLKILFYVGELAYPQVIVGYFDSRTSTQHTSSWKLCERALVLQLGSIHLAMR